MAVNLNPVLKYRTDRSISQPVQFRRNRETVKPKKIQRKLKIRLWHITLWFLLLGLIFFAAQKTWIFLISWEKLTVDSVIVESRLPAIKSTAESFMQSRQWGNLILLDIKRLRHALEMHRWIASVRIRKVFPSTVKIEIMERKPAAVIATDQHYLIDREGVFLDPVSSDRERSIPLFMDADDFRTEMNRKLETGWSCLESLSPEIRKRIDILDLTQYGNIRARLKDSDVWLKLGAENYSQRIQTYIQDRPLLETLGPLEYVDLRIPGRLIVKPAPQAAGQESPYSAQEAK